MQKLSKYSIGMGDRFAHQADWQLKVVMEAEKTGHEITRADLANFLVDQLANDDYLCRAVTVINK